MAKDDEVDLLVLRAFMMGAWLEMAQARPPEWNKGFTERLHDQIDAMEDAAREFFEETSEEPYERARSELDRFAKHVNDLLRGGAGSVPG